MKIRQPSKPRTANRLCILGFLDSLYAGAIAFAVSVVAPKIDKNGIPNVPLFLSEILPVLVAIVWIIDDWVCARLILQKRGYPENSYSAIARLAIDISIMGLSFALILSALPFRPGWYFTIFACILILGLVWALMLRREAKGLSVRARGEIVAILISHRIPAVVISCLAAAVWVLVSRAKPNTEDLSWVHRWSWWAAIVVPPLLLLFYKALLLRSQRRIPHG